MDNAATGIVAKVTEAIPQVLTLTSKAFEAITENELLVLFLAVGFVGIGISVFYKLKNVATSV